jgi:hypothetical protein
MESLTAGAALLTIFEITTGFFRALISMKTGF